MVSAVEVGEALQTCAREHVQAPKLVISAHVVERARPPLFYSTPQGT